MKKTNVMIEVSEELYESVVSPYKQRKKFGQLVVHLLEAYANNDSIYSYINGTIDEMEDVATEELLKELGNMTQSLSMMGVLGSQAETIVDNGQKDFEEIGKKAEKDINSNHKKDEKSSDIGITREDVQNIVNDIMGDIRNMLQQLLNSGISVSASEKSCKEEVSVIQEVGNEVKVDVVEEKHYGKEAAGVEEDSFESEDRAQKALSNLLDSVGF